jgi:mono/diheme cytochrome c family protein
LSNRRTSRRILAACGLAALLAPLGPAQAIAAEASDPVDFVRDVRPIFIAHCYDCHGPQAQESGFRLDRKAAALAGGDRGEPTIIAGNSADSPLWQFVSGADPDTHMPPEGEGEPLSAEQVRVLAAWIDQGAIWPDGVDEHLNESLTTDHWSFQPVAEVVPPATVSDWPAGAIDHFILAKLQAAELAPSPRADRVTLIRRLYLDLHGLPPTPEDTAAFVAEESPDAYAQLVDRLLASPRYGERWAQHWLDVVRFAESGGFETNVERPNAWPYRDYVISAFNDDKPYDQFLAEQLAGDALGAPVATGFLVAGPSDQVKSPELALTLMQRQDELADMANTTGTSMLGLTIGCARCHNHKFDPVLQKDYYALQAIFAGVQHGERPVERIVAADRPDDPRREPVSPAANEEKFTAVVAHAVRFTVRATTDGLEPCLDELEVWSEPDGQDQSHNIALAAAGGRPSSAGDYPDSAIHQLAHVNDGKYGNDWSWISNTSGTGEMRIDFSTPTAINRITWARDRTGGFRDRLAVDYSIEVLLPDGQWIEVADGGTRRPPDPATPIVYAGLFLQPEKPTHRLFRGDPMSPKEVVPPGSLTVLDPVELPVESPEQQRRVTLARWIASPDNPLTPRVMVNRIWQHHFGTGLVDTPSDFGGNGARPTHPELLDWLAAEFIHSGWSVKHMHRLVLLSAAYQQSSAPRAECMAVDADSRLLWRFPPRRLDAEAIRDSVLQATGELNLAMGGPGWRAFKPNDNYVRVYEPRDDFGPSELRRMIYMQRIRMRPEGVFGAFDAPDGGQVCPRRGRSITAMQALNLFNSNFMIERAAALAERLREDAGEEPADQIVRAFQLAFSRDPDEVEASAAQELITAHNLEAFCRSLLNASELMFIP